MRTRPPSPPETILPTSDAIIRSTALKRYASTRSSVHRCCADYMRSRRPQRTARSSDITSTGRDYLRPKHEMGTYGAQ